MLFRIMAILLRSNANNLNPNNDNLYLIEAKISKTQIGIVIMNYLLKQ